MAFMAFMMRILAFSRQAAVEWLGLARMALFPAK
jgi:hypothetical protein